MQPKGKFTNCLWGEIQNVFEQTISHPFVVQLANGTLPHLNFSHYLAQDILYIKDDSFALEKLSERAAKLDEREFFKSLSEDGIEIERALHNDFLTHFKTAKAEKKSPVIEKYTTFLISHSTKSPYPVAAAALLPCFWVYNKVGNHIFKTAVKNNLYQKWIETYQGEDYEIFTERFIKIVENLGSTSPSYIQKQMKKAFKESTRFELLFFEEAMLV